MHGVCHVCLSMIMLTDRYGVRYIRRNISNYKSSAILIAQVLSGKKYIVRLFSLSIVGCAQILIYNKLC